jgi:ABC-type transport system involved in cytochrome c biogenesis permease subunit
MLKRIVYVGFSIFLSYITYDLVLELWTANPSRYDLLESFVIAFLLVLFETGIFAYVGFIFPTSKLLPSQYYEVSNPRVIRRLYKIFGVVDF